MSHLCFYPPKGIQSPFGQGGQPAVPMSDLGLVDFISGALTTLTSDVQMSSGHLELPRCSSPETPNCV